MAVTRATQRGSALVVVLLIFAMAFALSVEIVYRQHHAQTRAGNLMDWDNRYQMAIAAETLAIQGLIDDVEDDSNNNSPVDDCKQEKWSGPFTFPYEDVVISASVQDLQGRFNVNWLVALDNSTGEYIRDQTGIEAFSALLSSVLPQTHASSASALANQMADWLDSDFLVNAADGAEDAEYRLYRTANHPVIHESELRSLLSFDEALAAEIAKQQAALNVAQANNNQTAASGSSNSTNPASQKLPVPLWQYVTALPGGSTLNVNTAPEAVLEAVLSAYGATGVAQQIIASRASQPYSSVADVMAISQIAALQAAQRDALQQRLTVSTEYFQVNIDVQAESGLSRLVTRIKRSTSQSTEVFSRAVIPVLGALEQACNPD